MASLLIVTVGLLACGRKGQLERPAANLAAAPTSPEEKPQGKPNRPFFLDRLIN